MSDNRKKKIEQELIKSRGTAEETSSKIPKHVIGNKKFMFELKNMPLQVRKRDTDTLF